jgi:hypothetical protein
MGHRRRSGEPVVSEPARSPAPGQFNPGPSSVLTAVSLGP